MMKKLLAAVALIALSAPVQAAQPASPAPADADARLSLARNVIGKLWPTGLYRRMMSGTMQQVVESTMASLGQIPADEMAKASGAKDADALKGKTLDQIAEAADPAYRERMRITMQVMIDEMIPLLEKQEPQIRESLAQSYARRFNAVQLADLDRFLSTPSGSAFADQFFLSYTDPEVMKQMQAFAPELMKAMPAIMMKVQAATAHLPPPPKPAGKTDH